MEYNRNLENITGFYGSIHNGQYKKCEQVYSCQKCKRNVLLVGAKSADKGDKIALKNVLLSDFFLS